MRRVPVPLDDVASMARANTVLLDVAEQLRAIAERQGNSETRQDIIRQIQRMIGEIKAIDGALEAAERSY